jgi:endonuclease/exonuclease/phosphatase family metal-dependent hydrolase
MHAPGRRVPAQSLVRVVRTLEPPTTTETDTVALTLATLNVKNLLEPAPDSGAAERALLSGKVAWIARMLRDCDADVVGLQEIGPPELLASVLAQAPLAGSGYGDPVLGTADARGIRCALLSRLPVIDARVHTAETLAFPVYRAGDPPPFGARIPLRRGFVHVRLQAPGLGAVDAIVVHFKSPRPVALRDAAGREIEPLTAHARAEGVLRSLVWRAAEALHARAIIDGLLAADPRAPVAILGDLNDVPDSPVARALQAEGDGSLLDCAAVVPHEQRFSAIHAGRRIQIDHILATPALYARLRSGRFLNAELREHDFPPDGNEPPTVDSDHAPLVVRFE